MPDNFLYFFKHISPFALAIVFLLVYTSENIYPQRRDLLDKKHDVRNIIVGIVNFAFIFFVAFYFQKIIVFFENRHFGLLQLLQLPFLIELMIGFVLIDCFLYWWHRINHVVPLFWFFHKFHHVDQKMNSTTALRFHTGELLLSYLVKIILFPLVGIGLAPILLHGLVLFPVIVFHHSNLKISMKNDLFLRRVIVTPHMHRVHHSDIKYDTDSNYSSIFPYWDILFGTYHKQSDKQIEFGV